MLCIVRDDIVKDFIEDPVLRRKAEEVVKQGIFDVHILGEQYIIKAYTYWNSTDRCRRFCRSIDHGRMPNTIRFGERYF